MQNYELTEASNGIELIYLEDRNVAGIHIRGLARLLSCDPRTVSNEVASLEAGKPEYFFDAEIKTRGGLQGVKFILEDGVIKILENIIKSSR